MLGSSRLRALLMQISMGMETIEAASMVAKNAGSLFTRNERKRNMVRLDPLRYMAFDRTSKAAVITSSMRTL